MNSVQTIRTPFRARNALVGLGLFGFCAAVYSYSIMAVKQENFDEVEKMIEQQKGAADSPVKPSAAAAST
ncbi:hypothetical protein RI367_003549 [Sorochytrium milnesiophthora]